MHTEKGHVLELILQDGLHYARLTCPAKMIPIPGQYLLAGDASDSTLPFPLFYTDSAPQGFIAAVRIPGSWDPGREVSLQGPLGRGFSLPPTARRVGLAALEGPPSRLRGLVQPALDQDAAVVLLSDSGADNLPDAVEVQPLSALFEIMEWTDFLALDVRRESLPELRDRMKKGARGQVPTAMQVLVRTPIPCGGIADCGVCAVTVRAGWKMACKDGPVFDWSELG